MSHHHTTIQRGHSGPRSTAAALLFAVLFPAVMLTAHPAHAQVPRVAPQDKFVFHDEQPVDRFVVQRWIDKESPEVSPAGYCECVTVVYDGTTRVLTLGESAGLVDVAAVADLTGDSRKELLVTTNSGGAHCCTSTAVYSIGDGGPKALLDVSTGNCGGELVDLDKDGIPEFSTCDDAFAYEFCSFAFSPMPPVVFAYSRDEGKFALATPRFAKYLAMPSANEARTTMRENRSDPSIVRCAALSPALALMYTGRMAQGQRLFRQLYQGPDARDVERTVVAKVMQSPLWRAQ